MSDHIEILSERGRRMLDLLLSDNPDQEELDAVLNCCMPAESNKEVMILLMNLGKRCSSLVFPESYSADFKEARSLYRRSVYRLSTHFETIASKMAESEIELALIKGGAMFCLSSSSPRPMADIDTLVKTEDFKKALEVARRAGYECDIDVHSADLHTEGSSAGVMDIHRFIPATSGKGKLLNRDILSRSVHISFCGADCLLPCPTDLLFISVTNFSRNLMDRMRPAKIMMTMLDLKKLISEGIDWDMFIEDCIKTGSQSEVSFTVSLINSLAPGMFPENIENISDKDEKTKFLNLFLFRRNVLVPLQKKRSELLLGKVVREPRKIPQFLILRPLYLFLKLFKYSPRMASTGIVKMITSRLPAHISR